MNAEQLLAHYERIADAPEAIDRLRCFVLDLAVSGELVGDTSGSWTTKPIVECLEWMEDGKKLHQGWSPQCNTNPSPSDETWGVLKTTAIQDGMFLDMHNKELPRPLSPKPHLEVHPDDILLTCAGPRARCGIACLVRATRPRLMISGKMYRFRADANIVEPSYLELFLRSTKVQAAIDSMKTGSNESGLNLTKVRFSKLSVSFGSLAEQRHIVAKVDKLMALCDQIEAERAEREVRRDRLTAASFARLGDSDPDTFQDDVHFVLNALPALIVRPNQVKALRKTILDLAMRGKLIPQNSNDESAAELLNRIAADKCRVRRGGVTIDPETAPYPIPASWAWASLDQLIVWGPRNGISPNPTTRVNAPKAITLTATTTGSFDSAHFKCVEASIQEDSDYWLTDGDLLFQRGNTREYVGMAAVYEGPPNTFLFPDLIMKVRISKAVSLRFVHLASVSPPARGFLSRNASGAQTTMPKINQNILVSLPIPLPPLTEQHRIVAKVDELMALCDQLEASLSDAAATRSRLLDALIADALAPVQSSEADKVPDREEVLV